MNKAPSKRGYGSLGLLLRHQCPVTMGSGPVAPWPRGGCGEGGYCCAPKPSGSRGALGIWSSLEGFLWKGTGSGLALASLPPGRPGSGVQRANLMGW